MKVIQRCNVCPTLKYHLNRFAMKKLPHFVITFALLSNTSNLTHFVGVRDPLCSQICYVIIFSKFLNQNIL